MLTGSLRIVHQFTKFTLVRACQLFRTGKKAIAQNKPVGARDMLADAPKDVGVVLWPDAVMVVTPLYNGRVPHFRQQRPHRSG